MTSHLLLLVFFALCVATVMAVMQKDDRAEQVRLTLDNLDRVLTTAGTSRNRVLHVRAFLVGIDHWDAFNRIFAEYFGDWRPARTVVPVPDLHFGYLVEIEAVAAEGVATS